MAVRDPYPHHNDTNDTNNYDDNDYDSKDYDEDPDGEGNWREDTWREDPYAADDVTALLDKATRLDARLRAEDSGQDIDPADGGWA